MGKDIDFGHFGHKWGMVLQSSLELAVFLEEGTFFIIIDAHHQKAITNHVQGDSRN